MAEEAKKPTPLPEPTEKQVLDLAGLLKTRFQGLHDEIAQRKALRWRKAKVMFGKDGGIPEEYQRTAVERRTPVIEYNVQQAQALTLSNTPVVIARPPSKDKQELATNVERFSNATIGRLEPLTGIEKKKSDGQISLGLGIEKFYPRKRPYPDFPEQTESESEAEWDARTEDWKKTQSLTAVFHCSYVPPETFYYMEDSKGLYVGMEIKQVDEWELMQDWGLIRTSDREYILSETGADTSQWEPGKSCEVIEYWNREWRVLLAKGAKGGTILDIWNHKFGRVPYFVAGAYETGETDPELRYIPLLWALYPEAEENNRLHTMRTNVAYFTGFPFYYVKTIASGELALDAKGQPKVITLKAGQYPQFKPGQELVPVNLASGFDLQAALRDSDERLKQYALPPIASGQAPSGETPAWGTRMLHRFLVTLLDPLLTGRAEAIAERTRFMLWCIKHVIGQKVYVNAEIYEEGSKRAKGMEPICLGPDDIADYDISVRIDPELEMDRTAQEAHGAQMVDGGKRAMMTFLEEDCGRDAPEEEMRRIDEDHLVAEMLPGMYEVARQWVQGQGAIERVLGGERPESVMKDLGKVPGSVGKGSPGQGRLPGVRMSPETPGVEESTTYTPAGGI